MFILTFDNYFLLDDTFFNHFVGRTILLGIDEMGVGEQLPNHYFILIRYIILSDVIVTVTTLEVRTIVHNIMYNVV